ncbi:hypothetical protein BAJUN_00230 [Bajunvirus bajun]|uniref:Uncharacterized protein n=1 Tax=Brevundimonas phage vB_BgoS-Bajun TaxID=2948594 RepID=A0A9E7N6H4_9CAUD|nr:hypothetical protein BAJUN_00230 [Brevundimonas phage vB_BgoS-Bajun]
MPIRAIAGFFAVGFLGAVVCGLLFNVLTGMPYTPAGIGAGFMFAVVAGAFTLTVGSITTVAKMRAAVHVRRRAAADRAYVLLSEFVQVKWGDRLNDPDDLTIQPMLQVLCDPTFAILKKMSAETIWSIETQRQMSAKLVAHELALGFTAVGKLAEVDAVLLMANNLAKMLNEDDFDDALVLKKISQIVQETRVLANTLFRKSTPA